MIENLITRLVASRRTLDHNVVRFGLRHLAFAAAILILSLCARAEIPFDSLHNAGVTDDTARSEAPGSGLPEGMATHLVGVPRTQLFFDLAVRGTLLHLDWKDDIQVHSIRIHDLHGGLQFTWKPPTGGGAAAIT